MGLARNLGIFLFFAGLIGFAYINSAQNIIVSGYSMAFSSYPLSVKSADEKISPTLREEISKVSPETEVNVVLVLTAPPTMSVAQQQLVISQLSAYNFKPLLTINHIGNEIAGTVPAGNIDEIASNPYVDKVLADVVVARLTSDIPTINFLSDSVPMIHAPDVWSKGYTGQGVTVIVIDSGIANNHPALMRDGKSLVLEEKDIVPGSTDWTMFHGTHVAGIIASQDPKYKGVAPGIRGFVDIVAFDKYGSATLSWLLSALDYTYSIADKYKPAVCTNSWGGMPQDTPEYNELRQKVLKLTEKIPVVFAAGNSGPFSGTIGFPGDADEVVNGKLIEPITVGAVKKDGTIAMFSSRGPDKWGTDHQEPDISAPGVDIFSTIPPSGWRSLSGTSMATPHVTGVVALMLSKNPYLDNMEVMKYLTETAMDAGSPGFDYDYGYGIVQADKAVDAVPSANIPASQDELINYGLMFITLTGFIMMLFPRPFERVLRW